jgi:ABC-type phosphate transport system substrate-binding protein
MQRSPIRKLALVLSGWCLAHALPGADYAVVVNGASPLSGLSSRDLAQIFKAEKQSWDAGGKIVLVVPKEGSKEEGVLLGKVYNTDGDGLKKYWTTLIYQNRISAAPKSAAAKTALKLVELKPEAITVVSAAEVPSGTALKVLAIDGKKPGESGYALTV